MKAIRTRFEKAITQLRSSERGIALPMAMLITVIAMGLAAVPIMASVNAQSGGSHSQAGNEALAAAETGAELAVLRQSQLLPPSTQPCVAVNPATEALSENAGYRVISGAQWCPSVNGEIGEAEYAYEVNPCYAEADGETECGASCENEDEDLIRVVSTGVGKNGGSDVPKRIQMLACSAYQEGPPTVIPGQDLVSTEQVLSVGETTVIGNKTITGQETVTGASTVTESSVGTTTETISPPNVFAKGQIVGIDSLTMHDNAQVYNGGAGSNGSVSMVGSANVCGTVSYGTTFTTDNSSSNTAPPAPKKGTCTVGRTGSKGISEFPPVTLPGDIATNNSNSRLVSADPVGANVWQRGNISWNSSNRSLTVSYDQLTLEGTAPYYLCKLTLAGGSKLLAGSGKKIRIFFDAPENCPGLNGSAQLQIANGAYVGPDASSGPGFYFVGSATSGASKVELGGGANVSQFVVYAPRSTVVANNGVNVNGVIIGKTLDLGGGAEINKSLFTPPSTGDFLGSTVIKKTTTTPVVKTVTYVTTTPYSKTEPFTTNTTYTTTTSKTNTTKGPDETVPGPDEALAFDRRVFVECSADLNPAAPDSGC